MTLLHRRPFRMAVLIAALVVVLVGVGVVWPGRARPDVWIAPKDGSELVHVPAGPFTMGDDTMEYDERPAHTVDLPGYRIGRYLVTNRQFAKFLNEVGNQKVGVVPYLMVRMHYGIDAGENGTFICTPGMEDHPVGAVSWDGARAYCQWAGLRLPTEAEWEKAARGTDARAYPWGPSWKAGNAQCLEDVDPQVINQRPAQRPRVTTAVNAHPQGASPFGCQDMAGNLWEWTSTIYAAYPYKMDARESPEGDGPRVTRGGAWYTPRGFLRTSNRYRKFHDQFEHGQRGAIGFRVACSDSPGEPATSPWFPSNTNTNNMLLLHTEPLKLTPEEDAKYMLTGSDLKPAIILGYPVTPERANRYPMPWERLEELLVDGRADCTQPDTLLDVAGVAPDDVAADIGCGSGYFTLRLSKRITRGKVFATDVSVASLQYLQKILEREDIKNVHLVLHDVTSTLLPPASLTLAFVSEVHYFHYPHAKPNASPPQAQVREYYRSIFNALKPGGRLVIWEDSDIHPDQDSARGILDAADIETQMKEVGFEKVRFKRYDCEREGTLSASRYFFIFRKPGAKS